MTLSALRSGRAAVDTEAVTFGLAARDGATVAAAMEHPIREMGTALRTRVEPAFAIMLAAGANVAAADIARAVPRVESRESRRAISLFGMSRLRVGKDTFTTISFDAQNQQAVSWAAAHAGELVTNITEESRAAIRSIIADAFDNGVPPARAARQIRSVVGLSGRDVGVLASAGSRLVNAKPGTLVEIGSTRYRVPAGGFAPNRIDQILDRYSDRLVTQRSMVIARTETIRAANEGVQQMWEQAVRAGEMTGHEERIWVSSLGARTCPVCLSLNGETRGLNEAFTGGFLLPPAHVMCRCSVGLTGKLRTQTTVTKPSLPPLPNAPGVLDAIQSSKIVREKVYDQRANANRAAWTITAADGTSFKVGSANFNYLNFDGVSEQFESVIGVGVDEVIHGVATIMSRVAGPGGGFERMVVRAGADQVTLTAEGHTANLTPFTITRTVGVDSRGVMYASHDYFKLEAAAQGSGAASQMVLDSLDLYDSLGLDRIEVHANIDVGGYAWARLGFQAKDVGRFKDEVERQLSKLGANKKFTKQVQDILNTHGVDAPAVIAALPEGKALLLNSDWEGILHLGRPQAANVRDRLAEKIAAGKGKGLAQ